MGVAGWSKEAPSNESILRLTLAFLSACICDAVNVDVRGSYHRHISAYTAFVVKHEWTWHEQIGLSDPRGDLAASGGIFWSSDRATNCTVQPPGVAYFLVGDFIQILYSLLTPSPPAIASYTTSHIPAANAFFYRSLPSSPLATVSDRSIRNAGLPVAPVVWPLLMGGEEAFDRGRSAIYFDLIDGVHV